MKETLVRDRDHDSLEQRVFILAPTGKDAALTASVLERAGVTCVSSPNLEEICEGLEHGGGAVLLAEEAVSDDRIGCLKEWLARQPPWSDLPVLVLARPGADSAAVVDGHGNPRKRHRAGATDAGRGARERRPVGAAVTSAAVPDSGPSRRARAQRPGTGGSCVHRRDAPTTRSSARRWTATSSPGTPVPSAFSGTRRRKPSASRSRC